MGEEQLPPGSSKTLGYVEIAARLRQRIEDGELHPGDLLPSLRDVGKEFEVTIKTANRAFQLLKQEGLTVAEPGVGTRVADRPHISSSGLARVLRLRRTGREYAPGETSTDHVALMNSLRDAEIAELLGVEVDDEVVIRMRTFRRGGVPSSFGMSYIHMRAFAHVEEVMTQGQLKPFWHDTYKERTGKEIRPGREGCKARHASDAELAKLELFTPSGAAVPVLVLRTVWYDEDGPISVWEDVEAPGSWKWLEL